jgi:membrane-bound metal-dependent hydrolase YbcI (DUF457 family)
MKLNLPALIVGVMLPDLEIPFILLISGPQAPERMILHSLIGGLSIGTLVGIAITVWAYPIITSAIFPINKDKVKKKCHLSSSLVISCFVGVLSHVLLDVANHTYNPIFWPFISLYQTPSPIVPALGGQEMASILIHGLMLGLFIVLYFKLRGNFWNRLLVE